MDIILQILRDNEYNDNDILNVYIAGSRLYGNITNQSDYDYVVIVNNYTYPNNYNHNIRHGDVDLTVISVEDMNKSLKEHNLQRLINIFTPPEYILYHNMILRFQLDLSRLRSAVSEISNKCLHHAKVSWKTGDYYKAKKHFIHSIRYVEFGIQIVKFNTICDLTV